MQRLRSLLFWIHLAAGVTAGAVILVMCVTGVALTYEKQMLEWADARQGPVTLAAAGRPVSPERLLAEASAVLPDHRVTGVTLRADPQAPATVAFEGGRALLVDPATGAVIGEPSPGLRRFFRATTSWHRWLALEGASRQTARAVTGAANLAFLFIVLSGLYLWLPKVLSWVQVRQVLWFRGGLPSKARDFNWHNVIGVWSAVPLAVVVAGAIPISYGWAGQLVYRLAGDVPPAPAGRGPQGPGAAAGPGPGGRPSRAERPAFSTEGLSAAVEAATSAVPAWRAATVRLAAAAAPLTVVVDEGYGGQPQHRTTLTVERDGRVAAREAFADLSPGRQWRSWFRFVHTGEYYGLVGQTVAGVVSAGGAVLVYTGLALSLRRFLAWRRRRGAPRTPKQAPANHRSTEAA